MAKKRAASKGQSIPQFAQVKKEIHKVKRKLQKQAEASTTQASKHARALLTKLKRAYETLGNIEPF